MTDAAPALGRPCPICGEGMLQPWRDFGRRLFARGLGVTAQLLWCEACGHKLFSPAPSEDKLAELYGGAYFASDSDREQYSLAYSRGSTPASDSARAWLARFGLREARVHEFGCGTGVNVHSLALAGHTASGSDWGAQGVAFARQMNCAAEVWREDMTRPRDPGPVDLFLSTDAIEHVADPVAMLRGFAALMRPHTRLLVRTNSGDGAVNRRLGMLFDGFFYFPHHLHYFSARSLAAAGRSAGLVAVALGADDTLREGVRDAALGYIPGESDGDRMARAREAFETQRVEAVFMRCGEPAPTPIPGLPFPRATAEWDSHEDFFGETGPWRRLIVRRTDHEPYHHMLLSEPENYFYWGHCFVGDHWLAHYDGEPVPMLAFDAPEAGDYEFEITFGLKSEMEPPVELYLDGFGERWGTLVTQISPRLERRRATLQAGQRVAFVVKSVRTPCIQKAAVLVAVRRIPRP